MIVGEAWMESAVKHPKLQTSLGLLRFFEKKYKIADRVWSVNGQFAAKKRKTEEMGKWSNCNK